MCLIFLERDPQFDHLTYLGTPYRGPYPFATPKSRPVRPTTSHPNTSIQSSNLTAAVLPRYSGRKKETRDDHDEALTHRSWPATRLAGHNGPLSWRPDFEHLTAALFILDNIAQGIKSDNTTAKTFLSRSGHHLPMAVDYPLRSKGLRLLLIERGASR